jgi:hypothetical protein
MRLLILAAAATLVVTGGAMARESVRHHTHHHHNASAPIAEGSADTLSAHDARMKNLHDSGYNSHGDLDPNGNIRQN